MRVSKWSLYFVCLLFVSGWLTIGCGGGTPCEKAFSKVKACWDKLDCSTISDADQKKDCEEGQKIKTYADSIKKCEEDVKKGPLKIKCACEGILLVAAEKTNTCELDEKTCSCKE